MPRVQRRVTAGLSPMAELTQTLIEYAPLVAQTKMIEKRTAPMKARMLALVQRIGDKDDKGSQWVELPQPIHGLKSVCRQRRVSKTFNITKAHNIIAEVAAEPRRKGESDEVFSARKQMLAECFITTVTFEGDEDIVVKGIEAGKPMVGRMTTYSSYLSEDRVMQAYAAGLLSAHDIKAMFDTNESWAFVTVAADA